MQKRKLEILLKAVKEIPEENLIVDIWETDGKVNVGGLACNLFEKEGLKWTIYKLNDKYRQPRCRNFTRYKALRIFFGLTEEQEKLIFYPYTISKKVDKPYTKEEIIKNIEQVLALHNDFLCL